MIREDGGLNGMSSHSDISCTRKGTYIISKIEGKPCKVQGFHDSYGAIRKFGFVNELFIYLDKNCPEYLFELKQAQTLSKS